MILIISSSLNPKSRSRRLAVSAHSYLTGKGNETELLDLSKLEIPFCDGATAYGHPNVSELSQKISRAEAILVASPVYNFDVNAVIKNVVELTGANAWGGKIVGFMLTAGGRGSYMSVMPFANSLMLDFRCLIVPRFVYATEDAFTEETIESETQERVEQLCRETSRLARLLSQEKAD